MNVRNFLVEVGNLMRQVTWPDKETLVQLTFVVILVSVAVGIFLGGADFLFTKMLAVVTIGGR